MIRIFRNLRSRLIGGGAFRKYLLYAIGEIVLVMIGILLALRVNNNNIARVEHEREPNTCRTSGLGPGQGRGESDIPHRLPGRPHSKSLDRLITYCDGIQPQDPDSLALDVIMSLYEYWFNPSNVTVKDLLGSGNMNLIRNASSRKNSSTWNCCISPILPTWSTRPTSTSSTSPNPSSPMQMWTNGSDISEGAYRRRTWLTVANFEGLLHDPVYRNGCAIASLTSLEYSDLFRQIL